MNFFAEARESLFFFLFGERCIETDVCKVLPYERLVSEDAFEESCLIRRTGDFDFLRLGELQCTELFVCTLSTNSSLWLAPSSVYQY